MTVVVVIIMVVAMMIGPVFMLQPSHRQQHLAATRTAAAKQGFSVRLSALSTRKNIAVYSRPWPERDDKKFVGVALVLERLSYEHELHLAAFWSAYFGSLTFDDKARPILENHINRFPGSILGLEISDAGIGIYWSEKEGEKYLPELQLMLNETAQNLMPLYFR